MLKNMPQKIFFATITTGFILVSNFALAQFIEGPVANQVVEKDSFDQTANVVTFLFALVFIFSIIGFMFSGVKFIIAGGSEKVLSAAHKAWISSLTGLIIAIVGYVIINLIRYYIR